MIVDAWPSHWCKKISVIDRWQPLERQVSKCFWGSSLVYFEISFHVASHRSNRDKCWALLWDCWCSRTFSEADLFLGLTDLEARSRTTRWACVQSRRKEAKKAALKNFAKAWLKPLGHWKELPRSLCFWAIFDPICLAKAIFTGVTHCWLFSSDTFQCAQHFSSLSLLLTNQNLHVARL